MGLKGLRRYTPQTVVRHFYAALPAYTWHKFSLLSQKINGFNPCSNISIRLVELFRLRLDYEDQISSGFT